MAHSDFSQRGPRSRMHAHRRAPFARALPVALLWSLVLLVAGCNAPAETATPPLPGPATPLATPVVAPPNAPPAAGADLLLPTPTPQSAIPAAAAAPTVSRLTTELLVSGLAQPVGLVNAGDGSGRLFVLEQAGVVRSLDGGAVADEPYLDLTDRVGYDYSEQGLLGLAFAPDFAQSGRFYVNYTNRRGDTTISRFTTTTGAGDGAGDPTSEEILLTIEQPASNHNGGNLVFGPDGNLWIGTGDGGAANDRFGNGQNPATLLGKMLRIDVSPATGYAIPADNPWVDATWKGQPVPDEVWAVGLRNPWRYSFDRSGGDLWIADVGQNEWEEVNRVPAGSRGGLNFGWPIQEASHCFAAAGCDTAGLVQPVLEYSHSDHCSITGGFVYRGAAFPAAQGAYIYADYCSGTVWAGLPQENGTWQARELLRSGLLLSAIGEGEAGELYLVDHGGAIYRMIFE